MRACMRQAEGIPREGSSSRRQRNRSQPPTWHLDLDRGAAWGAPCIDERGGRTGQSAPQAARAACRRRCTAAPAPLQPSAAPPRRGQHETRRGNDRATRIHPPHWRYGWRDDLRGGAGGIVPASVAKSRTTANVDTRCAFSSRQCKSLRKAHGCARPVRRRNESLMTPRLHVLSPPVPH